MCVHSDFIGMLIFSITVLWLLIKRICNNIRFELIRRLLLRNFNFHTSEMLELRISILRINLNATFYFFRMLSSLLGPFN